MQCGTNALQRGRALWLWFALLIFLGSADANAETFRNRESTEFTVPLQPFSLDPPAVHKVAEPVVAKGHRILRAVATAPIKALYYKQRRFTPRLPRANRMDDYDERDENDGQPIRVAYQSAPQTPVTEPGMETRGEHDWDESEEQENESETNPQIESQGDRPTVEGNWAVLRNGVAYAPSRAPENVKYAIWAANRLRRKPYVWGGGHGSFYDYGYDCSGSVSYALHGAGLIVAPLPSNDLMRYGERGRGRWITIYSRPGHTFAVIAGLRFDTTDLDRGDSVGPRWYAEGRDTRGYVARHPGGL